MLAATDTVDGMVTAAPRRTRRARTFLAVLTLAISGSLVVGAAPVSATSSTSDLRDHVTGVTALRNVATYVNRHRSANGIRQLYYDNRLQSAAQAHANWMASTGRMSHTGANGSSGGQRITAAGFAWSAWGENIAVGQTSSTAVFRAWRSSPGHNAVMLDSRYTHIGVGAAFGGGRWWWCLNVARG